MRKPLPLHPTLVHPRTGQPLEAVYVNARGRVFWPVMGGAPEDENDPPADPPVADPPAPTPPVTDRGYPENTPIAEMSDKEQAAYWKHNSRKHENRLSALGDIAELQRRAALGERLEYESLTEHERALEEAKSTAKAEAARELAPVLVEAAFARHSTGRLNAAGVPLDIEAIVGGLDPSKYLNAEGRPDTAKVVAYLDSIAPIPTTPNGPPARGTGARPGGGQPTAADGAELYASLHPKAVVSSAQQK